MLIEEVLPEVIGGKANLKDRLVIEGIVRGLLADEIESLISIVPSILLSSGCFLDRLTGLWRYEFGLPCTIGMDRNLWGTWMWIPVKHLFMVIQGATTRLPAQQRTKYFERLADPEKHGDYLVEFLPVLRLSVDTTTDFEVPTGVGKSNVDWRISTITGRPVLIDVKRRIRDLLEAMERLDAGERDSSGRGPDPTHDVLLLFRSIEQKFIQKDPALQLQGIWVATELQQEESELNMAFDSLDHMKVHFAVLGDWDPGIKLLARREEDRQFLLGLFQEEASNRFCFSRSTTVVTRFPAGPKQ